MSLPSLCFPESRITPPHEDDTVTHRFTEPTDDEVCWDADHCYQQRLIASEAIPLEMRGVTQQKPPAPHTRIPKQHQLEIWKKQTVCKYTVAAKLRKVGMIREAITLENCHTRYTIALCGDCGRVSKYPNRCDTFYCPQCAHHLQNERARQVGWWAALVKQPKHLTLTIRNIPDLTKAHVTEFRTYFTRLRRRTFARNWRGGFYRMEVTNENRGWHLHLHALIDADWIDLNQLKSEWRSITNGLGYIVDVRDARADSYLQKVTRYVVKGAELAAWDPSTIQTFIRAFTGTRTFGVFGELYGQRTEFAEFIATLKQRRPKCECGSCNVTYYDEFEFLMLDLLPDDGRRPLSPPATPSLNLIERPLLRWPD